MIFNTIIQIFEVLKLTVFATFSQFIWLFGTLFIFGFVLFAFSRFTRITNSKGGGRIIDIVFTGWIGTPVHELGHVIFCLIFRHKISEIKFYTPNSQDGTLGYVKHSYDTKSIYQNIGNFFIGIGPIALGSIIIYLLMILLINHSKEPFLEIRNHSHLIPDNLRGNFIELFRSIWGSIIIIFKYLFETENFSSYKFWIFIYISLSISSHMELSPWDIKGAWKGLIWILILFFTINLLIFSVEELQVVKNDNIWWKYIKVSTYKEEIDYFLTKCSLIFIFSTLISGLNFLLTYIGMNIVNTFRNKGLINPIW